MNLDNQHMVYNTQMDFFFLCVGVFFLVFFNMLLHIAIICCTVFSTCYLYTPCFRRIRKLKSIYKEIVVDIQLPEARARSTE